MKLEKNDRIYTIAETANAWKIETSIAKVSVSYSVPKEICKTLDNLKKYITENDTF